MYLRSLLASVALCGFVLAFQGDQPIQATPPAPCLKHLDGRKLVFVVNGAGDSTTVSDAITALTCQLHLPLYVQQVDWCRGPHPLADYKDLGAHAHAARRLAGWTALIRRECPNAEIYFVAHSSGVRIVLLAAESLPPRSVNRIVLIASVVSSNHDLRPALCASRCGIDHFWSPDDELLESVAEQWGLPDGSRGNSAGRVGFRAPPRTDVQGCAAYLNLRQYRWHEGIEGTGGHLTWTSRSNIYDYVLPLFFQPEPRTIAAKLQLDQLSSRTAQQR